MNLLTDHLEIWTGADNDKKSGRGRASGSAASVYGVKKLRELILELAVRGKLVPQDASDEPASELLKRIAAEKAKLIKEGKIKAQKPLAVIGEDEKPFELPMGWEWVRLAGVIDYVNGFAFSSKDFSTHGVGVVKIGDIQAGEVNIQSMSRVSMSVVANLDERLKVELGDLVIAMSGATTGKLGFNNTGEVFYLNQRVGKIVPFLISSKFLCIDLTTKISENLEKSFGSAIPNLSTEQINAIVIAIPPLAEQHRIVAKVDELMTLCDQLENQHSNAIVAHEKLVSYLLNTLTQSQDAAEFNESWQRIAANFDTLFSTESSIDALKQTVLQLAVMGKLVPQDANDEPASELLKRIQAEKAKLITEGKIKKDKPLAVIGDDEKPFELPKGWEWARLVEVSELITSGSRDWAQYLTDDGAKFITMGNLSRGSYELRLNNMRYVSPPKDGEGSRTKLEAGDLVISITGDVGNLGRIPEGFGDAYINQHACLLRFVDQCRNRYFPEVLRSPMAVLQFNAPQRGIKNSFRLGDVGEMVIPLPPLAEQHRIVAKVDELMAICDQLKTRISTANQLQQKLADVLVGQAVA